jgi:uncharacterized protein related to proFAR isomerase
MSKYIPVEGFAGLYRDPNSQAIVNRDRSAYEAYIAQRDAMQTKAQQFEQMRSELETVKDDITDIKDMLSIIVQKLNT